jgi:adenosylcobinamide amidohydrolase
MAANAAADIRRAARRQAAVAPWSWRIHDRTLIVELPVPYRVIGWAPLGGGLVRASAILNHRIAMDDRAATEAPRAYLRRVARQLGFDPGRTIAMMTAADIPRAGFATIRRGGLIASAWCSAGCSNALRVGDRATAGTPAAGTINLIAAINRPLTDAALAEALQIAVEARVAAVLDAGIKSVRSGASATGTGTDCVAIAAPEIAAANRAGAIVYCGKHTLIGETIGRAALRACAAALARSIG